MKQLLFSAAFVMGFFVNAMAQDAGPKIIALVNKASWCHVCKEHGPRVEKDLMPMMMANGDVRMVVNDLSDEATIRASEKMAAAAGISSFAKKHPNTGMIYFLDAWSKKLISGISIARSNKAIKMAFMEAVSKS